MKEDIVDREEKEIQVLLALPEYNVLTEVRHPCIIPLHALSRRPQLYRPSGVPSQLQIYFDQYQELPPFVIRFVEKSKEDSILYGEKQDDVHHQTAAPYITDPALGATSRRPDHRVTDENPEKVFISASST